MTIIQHPDFKNFHQIEHPLILHKLSILRDKSTSKKEFKELINEITLLLAYEATKSLQTTKKTIQTPLESTTTFVLKGKKPVILPILRAGIGMVDAFLSLMPSARVGHIGLFRDEKTLQPHRYYFRVPNKSSDRHFFICDPMLATGGSAKTTIDELKKIGVKGISFMCIVASPEGVAKLYKHHPDIPIYAASLDRQLDQNGYILPGLGDAGDRLFGTNN